MPYVSERQRRFFHTATASKKGISYSMVKEYDEATKAKEKKTGKKLPEKAPKRR